MAFRDAKNVIDRYGITGAEKEKLQGYAQETEKIAQSFQYKRPVALFEIMKDGWKLISVTSYDFSRRRNYSDRELHVMYYFSREKN